MENLKPATIYAQQIELIKSRGIDIENEEQCISVLSQINYYRITAYFLPFKQENGNYLPGTSFNQVYHIYEFDRKFRSILLSIIEEIEILYRAKISYFHAHKYGPEGYLDPSNFSNRHNAIKTKECIEREIKYNQNSLFIQHHQTKYACHFPIWVIIEIFTLGMLSKFFGDLTTEDQKEILRNIYGNVKVSYKNAVSWLRCCTDLRNICAHYGRLYFRVFPSIPAGFNTHRSDNRSLWAAIFALKCLYPNSDKWNNSIIPQIESLFEEYETDISLKHIGFPENWKNEICKYKEQL